MIYTNAANSRSLVLPPIKKHKGCYRDKGVVTKVDHEEGKVLIAKHKLVKLPIEHRSYILEMTIDGKVEASSRIDLLELETDIPGVWFRSRIRRIDGNKKTLPCYFAWIPKRRKRDVYDFDFQVYMVHAQPGGLALFDQPYYNLIKPVEDSFMNWADFSDLLENK